MVKLSRFQNILMFESLDLYCSYVSLFWELNHRGLILWISLDAQNFFFSLCNSHQFTIKYGIFMSVCCFKCLIPYHRIPPVLNDAAVARFAKASRWHVGAFRVGGAIHGATGPWKRCIYGAMQLGWGRTKT